MKSLVLTLGFIAIGLASYCQSINAKTSKVSFKISSLIFNSVEGDIKGMNGSVNFNENNLGSSSFRVCVNPKTIDTGNEERDAHLKNADFFDVSNFPDLCFESKSVTTSGGKHFKYKVLGNVTIYDTTKEENIIFSKEGSRYVGKMEINRFDYNLGAVEYDGTFMVGDEVEIEIICELN